MIRCVVYSEVLGRMCGQPAYVFDRDRSGWVCAEHCDSPRGQEEELAEATVTLAIRTQATLIEHQLALKKIFLARSSRCLTQSKGEKVSIDVLAGRASDEAMTQGARSQHEPHKLCVLGSTPSPASPHPDGAINPNASAFSHVHVVGGGRW